MTDTTFIPREESPQPDLAGRRLGDYQLLRRLGRGAMAEVYLAEQVTLRRQVAVKILRSDLANDKTYVQRFHNEAMAAAKLVHANIVQIYEVGEADGIHYIAQEYVPGRNLGELIQRSGPPDVKLAVAIVRQVAAALSKAAEQGIVHRDIKPENIMLARTGEVKVADFGLARFKGSDGVDLTRVGITMGTPLYMSPEQIEGKPLDSRSDLYSLGVTCFHMLTGEPPFSADTALAVAVKHMNESPPRLEDLRPDLPGGFGRIVHKLMAKKPDDRYESPRELLRDLRALRVGGSDENWADGLEEWSAAEMIALSDARIEATERLDSLMKTSSLLTPRKPRRGRFAAAGVLCLLLGAAGYLLIRPAPLLSVPPSSAIPKMATPIAQIFHAKTSGSEAAWRSVWEYFPEDTYAMLLAKQGLARHYLWQTGEYQKAVPILDELAAQGDADVEFRAFGIAGKCVVYGLEGKTKEAQNEMGRLTSDMADELRRLDPRMSQALRDVLSNIEQKMDAQTKAQFDTLKSRLENGIDENGAGT